MKITTIFFVMLFTTCATGKSPPPGYKHTAFRLIVPQTVIEHGALHWHDALRHATFLSLRRGIGSYETNSEMTLWRRINSAPITQHLLAKPINEDADITTMATGVLTSESGRLSFMPEAALLEISPLSIKLVALWSVLRVRHSGPGLSAPRIEYYFTVQPAAYMTLMNYMEKQRNKILYKKPLPKPKPTYYYKEINVPPFGKKPEQYYNPEFLSIYRNTVQNYIAQTPDSADTRDSLEQNKKTYPMFAIPGPRYTYPSSFPRVSQLAPKQSDLPQLIRILTPRYPTGTNNNRLNSLPLFEPRTSILLSDNSESSSNANDNLIQLNLSNPIKRGTTKDQHTESTTVETTTKWITTTTPRPASHLIVTKKTSMVSTKLNTLSSATQTPTLATFTSITSTQEPTTSTLLPNKNKNLSKTEILEPNSSKPTMNPIDISTEILHTMTEIPVETKSTIIL